MQITGNLAALLPNVRNGKKGDVPSEMRITSAASSAQALMAKNNTALCQTWRKMIRQIQQFSPAQPALARQNAKTSVILVKNFPQF